LSSTPLHILEKKVLKALQGSPSASVEEIAKDAELMLDQVRRALEWLNEKKLVQISHKTIEQFLLTEEGTRAVREGLPEQRLLDQVTKSVQVQDLIKTSGLTSKEFSVAFGTAKTSGWVGQRKEGEKFVVFPINRPGMIPQEEFLSYLSKHGSIASGEITDSQKGLVNGLIKRHLVSHKVVQTSGVTLTVLGDTVATNIHIENEIDALTPDIIISGKWKDARFRPLNVEAPAPAIYAGKKHPLQSFTDEVREIFISMGFEEIDGPLVQSSFWNFDALFTPQDHPSREMQDTFYLAGEQSKNPAASATLENVSNAHINGGSTGSKGWGYKWNLEEAKRTVLRTHTTSTTVRYLADNKPEEARVFSVGRVFRNEKVSYKHIVEFHQVEGIVVGKNATMRDIMGLLGKFYQKLGFQKTKFWPTYFPYTEPSLQSMVYFENLDKWLELGGMGIFRPEVSLPLGVKNPVLAWGLGLERLVMLRYDIDDIREIYGNNLNWLRSVSLRQ